MSLFLRSLMTALLLVPTLAQATSSNAQEHDPIANVILWVTLIFGLAILGRYLAKRLHQPGVLGELIIGIIFGNVCYFFGLQLIVILREGSTVFNVLGDLLGNLPLAQAITQTIPNPHYGAEVMTALSSAHGMDFIKIGYALDLFSRFGVIFLLFMVGLESSVEELKHTGRESLQVALIGVIAPICLGLLVAYLLLPESHFNANLFIAATLSATSIGITARVLSELKILRTREARTILGAAMLDDILGLIILAIVSSIVVNGQVNMMMIFHVVSLTLIFFAGVLLLGPWLLRQTIRCVSFLELWEAKLFISFMFVMLLSWLATVVQLAAIIGAFAAGMIINDAYFDSGQKKHLLSIKDLIAPLEFILAPLFFMLIGIQVKMEAFFDGQVLSMAAALIVAAVVGKLISGLGGNRQDDRWLIGVGMLPRGEVGLVFASIGRSLGVMSDQLFSAIILMVIVTTIMVPPLLKARYAKTNKEVAG